MFEDEKTVTRESEFEVETPKGKKLTVHHTYTGPDYVDEDEMDELMHDMVEVFGGSFDSEDNRLTQEDIANIHAEMKHLKFRLWWWKIRHSIIYKIICPAIAIGIGYYIMRVM